MSGKPAVPEEAVEAAAREFRFAEGSVDDRIRKALEAAASFIAAKALEDAAEAIDADPYDDLDPYYADWLRDRARCVKESE